MHRIYILLIIFVLTACAGRNNQFTSETHIKENLLISSEITPYTEEFPTHVEFELVSQTPKGDTLECVLIFRTQEKGTLKCEVSRTYGDNYEINLLVNNKAYSNLSEIGLYQLDCRIWNPDQKKVVVWGMEYAEPYGH